MIKKKITSFILAVLMFFSLRSPAMALEKAIVGSTPSTGVVGVSENISAQELQKTATDTISEFDFSAADALDAYDSYEKKVSPDGYAYVETTLLNRIDTTSNKSASDYRYGAYLRNSEERQYYSVFNLNYGGKITSNVLTICADPYVKFRIVDADGVQVVDYTSQYDISKVAKYKKSTDFGHNVYYIEFVPMQSGQSTLMIEFSSASSSVQPHYSFWFGHPLTRADELTFALLDLSLNKPRTKGDLYPFLVTGIPRESWVTSIVVTKTREDDLGWVSSVNLTVYTPGETKSNLVASRVPASVVFNYDINSRTAHSAYGTYNFQIVNMVWNPKMSGPALYKYKGTAHLNYLYAFGAPG